MKAVGSGGGGGWWRMTVLTEVEGERVASSPVVIGGSEAIIGGQSTMAN
jgi:hypothetical protein